MDQSAKALTKYCNGCANRCPITAMQCAKGLKLMGLLKEDDQKDNKAGESLGTLLRACSNKLFVGGAGESFFDVLTVKEKEKLREYLSRLSNQ